MKEHEFGIIEHYFKPIARTAEGVELGPGDDCTILTFPADSETCVSTDTLVEGVHFPHLCPATVVAARTLGANLSDLAAMGAVPHSFLLAMTLPEVDDAWLSEFSTSLSNLMTEYEIALSGGNLARGSLSLTVTVIGTVPAGKAVRRDGAGAGDQVFVTGTLGDAGEGLELVRGGDYDHYLAGRYCAPTPRIAAGMALREVATAMIDISDGLMADLGHVAEASGLGAVVESESLPLSDALVDACGREKATRMALFSGDDYELCFTVKPEDTKRLEQITDTTGVKLTRVGYMHDGEGVVAVDTAGSPIPFSKSGYLHF